MKLGEFLREEREKKGISLEEVSEFSKVRASQLTWLEEDRIEKLPPMPFLRGMVEAYCKYIGLDTEPVLHEFKDYFEKPEPRNDVIEGNEVLGGYTYEKTRREPGMILILFMIIFGLSVAGLAVYYYFFSPDKSFLFRGNSQEESVKAAEGIRPGLNPTPPVSRGSQPVKTGDKKAADSANQEVQPTAIPTAKPEPTATSTPETRSFESVEPSRKPKATDPLNKGDTLPPELIRYKLVLKATDDVWIRYQVDNHPPMKYKLLKDRLMVFRAEQWIALQTTAPELLNGRLDKNRSYVSLEKILDVTERNNTPSATHPRLKSGISKRIFDTMGPFTP